MSNQRLYAWVTHIYQHALEILRGKPKEEWTKVTKDILAGNGHTYRVTAYVKKGSELRITTASSGNLL